MTNFPAVNNKDVSAAPIQTSLQAILVSGRNLKIIANRTVIESRERRKSRDSNQNAGIGSMPPRYFVTAARSALSNSETKSKNPMPSTMPKLRKRSLTRLGMPDLVSGRTCQMLFRASCISQNTPEAPKNNANTPIMLPITP